MSRKQWQSLASEVLRRPRSQGPRGGDGGLWVLWVRHWVMTEIPPGENSYPNGWSSLAAWPHTQSGLGLTLRQEPERGCSFTDHSVWGATRPGTPARRGQR